MTLPLLLYSLVTVAVNPLLSADDDVRVTSLRLENVRAIHFDDSSDDT